MVATATGCSGKSGESEKNERRAAPPQTSAIAWDAAPAVDAGPPPPSAQDAHDLLQKFTAALVAKNFSGARAMVRPPKDMSEVQVDHFLRELLSRGHLSVKGVEGLADQAIVPLESCYGPDTATVAKNLGAPANALWCLGTREEAAVFLWEGGVLRVAAVIGL